MKKINCFKESSGVTLIILVITIIILLIIAGISVMSLMGDKNLINQSMEAKNQANLKDAMEDISQQWLLLQNDTLDKYYSNSALAILLQERLINKGGSATVTYSSNKFNITYKDKNFILDPSTNKVTEVES